MVPAKQLCRQIWFFRECCGIDPVVSFRQRRESGKAVRRFGEAETFYLPDFEKLIQVLSRRLVTETCSRGRKRTVVPPTIDSLFEVEEKIQSQRRRYQHELRFIRSRQKSCCSLRMQRQRVAPGFSLGIECRAIGMLAAEPGWLESGSGGRYDDRDPDFKKGSCCAREDSRTHC